MRDRGEGEAGRISAAISPPYCTKKHTAISQYMNINAPGRFFHDLHKGANGKGGLDCGKIYLFTRKGVQREKDRGRGEK